MPSDLRAPIDLETRRRGRPSMVVNDILRGALRIQREEAAIELTVSRAERVTFATQVQQHVRMALLALYQVQPDVDAAERSLAALARLSAREEARAQSAEWAPDPGAAMAVAA